MVEVDGDVGEKDSRKYGEKRKKIKRLSRKDRCRRAGLAGAVICMRAATAPAACYEEERTILRLGWSRCAVEGVSIVWDRGLYGERDLGKRSSSTLLAMAGKARHRSGSQNPNEAEEGLTTQQGHLLPMIPALQHRLRWVKLGLLCSARVAGLRCLLSALGASSAFCWLVRCFACWEEVWLGPWVGCAPHRGTRTAGLEPRTDQLCLDGLV